MLFLCLTFGQLELLCAGQRPTSGRLVKWTATLLVGFEILTRTAAILAPVVAAHSKHVELRTVQQAERTLKDFCMCDYVD